MPNRHEILDRFKILAAKDIVENVDLPTIRSRSLSNLDRWNANGVWVSAHDEWRALMAHGTDAEVIAAMTGPDQRSNRLRQSPPYVGLITEDRRQELLKLAGFFSERSDEADS
jgi:hypothetical protein